MASLEITVLMFVISFAIGLAVAYWFYKKRLKKIVKKLEGGEHDGRKPKDRIGEGKGTVEDIGGKKTNRNGKDDGRDRGREGRTQDQSSGRREQDNAGVNRNLQATGTDVRTKVLSDGEVKVNTGTERTTKKGVQLSDFTPI